MNAFATDPFTVSATHSVAVDIYTSAYRISGKTVTRFARVADIVNQIASTHLVIDEATVSEYADASATLGAQQVLVTVDEILFLMAADTESAARPEMRIQKRAVRAQLGLPPFRLTGSVHVPQGSRPADGLLNVVERFMPMTEVTISSSVYPELGRTTAAVALQRQLAHVLLVTDDERPDQLLADVLDAATAERWLKPRESDEAG
ncbi:MAG: hypothetical protein OEW24_04750 [Chloroflexota bacterium]|nr:hypothetical protein [Chloroflexota bacterium]